MSEGPFSRDAGQLFYFCQEKELKYTTRATAIGLTDPWNSLNMDRSVLPKIETSDMRKKRMDQMHVEPKRRS